MKSIPNLLVALITMLPITASVAGVTTVYTNGKVYTVNPNQPWAEAFAVADDRIVAVGTSQNLKSLTRENTRVVDLKGKLVLPGLIDDHIHPDMAAESYANVSIDAEADNYEDFRQAIEAFLAKNPSAPWVFGGNVDYLWDDGSHIRMFDKPSHKSILDAIVSDRPAYFWEVSGHAALVNSKALEALGITKDTPDPPGGHWVKDENGELTGVVRETAAHVVWEESLKTRPSDKVIAYEQVLPVFQYLSSLGLTSITDVWAREWFLKAYNELDRNDVLPLRVSAYVSDPVEWVSDWMKELASKPISNPEDYSSENVNVLGVKFVLDGGAAGRTAVLTEPYEGTEDYYGPWRNDPDLFVERFLDYDRRGLTVRAHAAGDGAARLVLDTIERARRENGSTLRHGVAHSVMIHPIDLPRFAELGVIAESSPFFWYQMAAVEVVARDIGTNRVNALYPMRKLHDSGAHMSVGSDWTVTPANPWLGIETMVTRRAPGDTTSSPLNADLGLTLEEAIKIYTLGGAYAQYREADLGSIAPGKLADFIILDRNIFEIPIHQVHQTQVESTVVGGREVYNRQQSGDRFVGGLL